MTDELTVGQLMGLLEDIVARYAQVINELAHERELLRLEPPAAVVQLRRPTSHRRLERERLRPPRVETQLRRRTDRRPLNGVEFWNA